LERQISICYAIDHIEVITLCDNKRRSIGAKRQALLNLAQGKYVTFLDDDDRPAGNYTEVFIRNYSQEDRYLPDVFTFNQKVILNGEEYTLQFQHGHPTNDELVKDGITIRPPWHVCFWRRETVHHCTFPDSNYGEDWAWAEQANKKAKYAHHINHEMMTYVYDSKVSEANPE
jgi:glycosyltransferase involved in cell wall biosynthesis